MCAVLRELGDCTLSVVTSGSRSTIFGGKEEEVVGIAGSSYEAPLLVVIALRSPLGLAIVLLGKVVPEPEGQSFKDFLISEIWLTNNLFNSS